ncbi:MAG: hypothetical protein R3F12_02550 [Lysobacteraceae bacterium]|nr:hypothetical protein [Xanthomonadales bacterium]HRX99142.1 hypothetical protein [Xanthomonadaceae bacterium]
MRQREKITFWSAVPPISLGLFCGLVVLLALRVMYYEAMGFQPNMAPAMAFFFLPVVFVMLFVVVLPLEAAMRALFATPTKSKQAFFIGTSYALLLVWWAFPNHWWLMIICNPVVCRWFIR